MLKEFFHILLTAFTLLSLITSNTSLVNSVISISVDISSLKNEITKLETNNPIVAYACYIFSKFNFTDLNNILDSIYNKIKDEKDFSLTKLSYVGLAYFYNGDIVKAKEIASIIERYIKKETRSISIDVFKNYYHDNGK